MKISVVYWLKMSNSRNVVQKEKWIEWMHFIFFSLFHSSLRSKIYILCIFHHHSNKTIKRVFFLVVWLLDVQSNTNSIRNYLMWCGTNFFRLLLFLWLDWARPTTTIIQSHVHRMQNSLMFQQRARHSNVRNDAINQFDIEFNWKIKWRWFRHFRCYFAMHLHWSWRNNDTLKNEVLIPKQIF